MDYSGLCHCGPILAIVLGYSPWDQYKNHRLRWLNYSELIFWLHTWLSSIGRHCPMTRRCCTEKPCPAKAHHMSFQQGSFQSIAQLGTIQCNNGTPSLEAMEQSGQVCSTWPRQTWRNLNPKFHSYCESENLDLGVKRIRLNKSVCQLPHWWFPSGSP